MNSKGVQERQNRITPQYRVTNMMLWNFGPRYTAKHINTSTAASFKRMIHLSMVAQSDCLRAEYVTCIIYVCVCACVCVCV